MLLAIILGISIIPLMDRFCNACNPIANATLIKNKINNNHTTTCIYVTQNKFHYVIHQPFKNVSQYDCLHNSKTKSIIFFSCSIFFFLLPFAIFLFYMLYKHFKNNHYQPINSLQ